MNFFQRKPGLPAISFFPPTPQLIESSRTSRTLALVVSTENLTENLYTGNERSMMLQNTLFRCGGAAMLLSSHAKFSIGKPAPKPYLQRVV